MKRILLSLITILSISAGAQISDTSDRPKNDITGRFDKMIKESGSYKEFRVIKTTEISALKKAAASQIDSLNNSITLLEQSFVEKNQQISVLNNQITDYKENIDLLKSKRDNINILGLSLSKTIYNIILWSIILLLLVLLFLFIYKFKNSNTVTLAAQENLNTLEEEFELHRRNALEKEQRLNRQLLDERKKNA